eukprot:4125528-Pyramimonas_sp.AAC.1
MGNSGDCGSDDAPPSYLFYPCSFELAPTSEGTASRSRASGWKAGESAPRLVREYGCAGKAWRTKWARSRPPRVPNATEALSQNP